MSNKYFNFSFSFWYPLGIILTFFITLTSAARIDLRDPEKLLLCYVLVYLCAEYVCVSLNFRLCVCLCMLNVYEWVCVCVWVSVGVCLFACACLKWAIECVWVYVCVCVCKKSTFFCCYLAALLLLWWRHSIVYVRHSVFAFFAVFLKFHTNLYSPWGKQKSKSNEVILNIVDQNQN